MWSTQPNASQLKKSRTILGYNSKMSKHLKLIVSTECAAGTPLVDLRRNHKSKLKVKMTVIAIEKPEC